MLLFSCFYYTTFRAACIGFDTRIIYATKVNQKTPSKNKRKDFWYFDVKSDGYSLDNHRRKLETPSDLSKYEEYRKLDVDQADEMMQVGFEIIPLKKVRQNSFILVGSKYRELKNSNALFELVLLKDVCDINNTAIDPIKAYGEKAFTYIDIASIQNNTGRIDMSNKVVGINAPSRAKRVFRHGDILMSTVRPNLKAFAYIDFIPEDCVASTGFAVLSPNNRIVGKYLYYLLFSDSIAKQLADAMGKAMYPSVNRNDLERLEIPLPPFEIQQQIINELEGYQKIVDGARTIVENYKPNIPRNIYGEIKTLENIAVFKPSKDEIRTLDEDTLVSFVPMADLNTHSIEFTASEERPIYDVRKGFTYFRDNDILLAKISPCFENGKAGIAHNLKNGVGFGSTEYIVIRADTDIVYPEWIYYHINSPEFVKNGKTFMTGTAGQQRIDLNYVKHYSIPVPSLEEQARILSEIEAEQSLIEPNKKLIDVFSLKIQNKISGL
jgi:type I restriction enzyme M protein